MAVKSKVALHHYNDYLRSNMDSLSDAYGRHSKAKDDAFRYCQNLMAEYRGRGLKILSANTYQFTAGFEFFNDETGELSFMYITATYDRWYPLTWDLEGNLII